MQDTVGKWSQIVSSHEVTQHHVPLMMSPSWSFRWSGIPWQITSFIDLAITYRFTSVYLKSGFY